MVINIIAWIVLGYAALLTVLLVVVMGKLVSHIREDDLVHKDVVILQKLVSELTEAKKTKRKG